MNLLFLLLFEKDGVQKPAVRAVMAFCSPLSRRTSELIVESDGLTAASLSQQEAPQNVAQGEILPLRWYKSGVWETSGQSQASFRGSISSLSYLLWKLRWEWFSR